MIVVLDASAALKVVGGDEESGRLAQALRSADSVCVPGVYAAETANALWKYVEFGELSLEAGEQAVRDCLELTDRLIPDDGLAVEAFGLACSTRLTVYDALYLILARRLGAYLATFDEDLTAAAKRHSIKILSLT